MQIKRDSTDKQRPPALSYEANVYTYHSDHLGSVSLITQTQGKTYEEIEYTPHGEIFKEITYDKSLSFDVPFKFTGKELDEETGLYYNSARYRQPQWNIWMSTDPALHGLRNPSNKLFNPDEGLNPYAYVSHNPLKYTDPTGMMESARGDDGVTVTMGFTPIMGGVASHAYLEIKDNKTGDTYGIRGGPEGGTGASASSGGSSDSSGSSGFPSAQVGSGASSGGSSQSSGSSGEDWGNVKVHKKGERPFTDDVNNASQMERVESFTTDKASFSSMVEALDDYAKAINDSNTPYNPVGDNSNATAFGGYQLLNPENTRSGSNTGGDGMLGAPGSQRVLVPEETAAIRERLYPANSQNQGAN